MLKINAPLAFVPIERKDSMENLHHSYDVVKLKIVCSLGDLTIPLTKSLAMKLIMH